MRYLKFKLLKYEENKKKICNTFDHNFKNIPLYTRWPNKNGTVDTVDFQDFALINSYFFSPCWIEHLFLIIITPRSSNLVENFYFMSNFLWTVIFGICPISRVSEARSMTN